MILEKSDWINQNDDLDLLNQAITKLKEKCEKILKQLNCLKNINNLKKENNNLKT